MKNSKEMPVLRIPKPSRAALKVPKKSSYHFVGQTTFGEDKGQGQCLAFGSLLEYHTSLMLIYAKGIIDVEEQIAPVVYLGADGKTHKRWFDFRTTRIGGEKAVYDVKNKVRADTAIYRDGMKRVAAAAMPGTADKVFVVTEQNIKPERLQRVKLFHDFRFPQPQFDFVLSRFVANFTGQAILRDLLRDAGLGDDGFHAAVRLIRQDILSVPDDVRITLSCIVSKVEVSK